MDCYASSNTYILVYHICVIMCFNLYISLSIIAARVFVRICMFVFTVWFVVILASF